MRATLNQENLGVLVPVIMFPAAAPAIGLDQNAFLTAGLFGAATLCIDRRPIIAGILFACLCYKPQFGLLIPVALAAGGNWRAFAVAFATLVMLILGSLILFGWETWLSFLLAARSAWGDVYATGKIGFGTFISPFGGVMLMGGSSALAYGAQALATVGAVIFVAAIWYRNFPLPVRAAALVASTLAAFPEIFYYDLILGTVAATWLIRRIPDTPRSVPISRWQELTLVGLYILLWPWKSFAAWHVPIGMIAVLTLIALVAVRAFKLTL